MKEINIKMQMAALAMVVSCLSVQSTWAESLYEFYSNTPVATLKQETGEMGRQLRTTFDQNVIAARQQDIDFAEYYANLKKLIFYGGKLATYAQFNRDLAFARDNEIFKGLPSQGQADSRINGVLANRKEYAHTKYEKMKSDVQEEIATYKDMLQLSMDSCQAIMGNDFSNLATVEIFRARVRGLMRSKDYQHYQANRERLAMRWEELASGIEAQFNLWKVQAPSPEAPILDPMVVGAL